MFGFFGEKDKNIIPKLQEELSNFSNLNLKIVTSDDNFHFVYTNESAALKAINNENPIPRNKENNNILFPIEELCNFEEKRVFITGKVIESKSYSFNRKTTGKEILDKIKVKGEFKSMYLGFPMGIFINEKNLLSIKNIAEFRNRLEYQPDFFHITSAKIDNISKKITDECQAVSERTGDYINFFPYRARRTLGTDLARQGIGGVQIAHLLDHSDTQNVGIYTEDNIEQSLRIFEAMDEPMNLLADMFAGRIIRHESEAIRADDINSRKFKNDGKQIGNCGGSSACQNGIKACLICSSFQPLLGADWNELLEDLNQERLFQSKNGASELVLSSYDLPLANTAAIMEACNKILVDESYA